MPKKQTTTIESAAGSHHVLSQRKTSNHANAHTLYFRNMFHYCAKGHKKMENAFCAMGDHILGMSNMYTIVGPNVRKATQNWRLPFVQE